MKEMYILNSCLYSRGSSSNKALSSAVILDCRIGCRRTKFNTTNTLCYVYLKSFLLIVMVELDNRRSAVKTLVNTIGLNT